MAKLQFHFPRGILLGKKWTISQLALAGNEDILHRGMNHTYVPQAAMQPTEERSVNSTGGIIRPEHSGYKASIKRR
jgi:hypothetical protein